eukprot:557861_1
MSEIPQLQVRSDGKFITIPAFWFCVIYTLLIFCWAIIYFCCNTVGSLHKHCNRNMSSCGSVSDGSKCCNKITYLFDVLASCSDAALALFIVCNTSMASTPYLWRIFSYISCVVFAIGILLLIVKFKVLSTFYPFIVKYRSFIHTESVSNTSITVQQLKAIKCKHHQISLLLKHQIMFDLFSASLQDSVQSAVVLYILADLEFKYCTNPMNYNPFHWVLILKLILSLFLMIYKLFRVIGSECNCHVTKIQPPRLKYDAVTDPITPSTHEWKWTNNRSGEDCSASNASTHSELNRLLDYNVPTNNAQNHETELKMEIDALPIHCNEIKSCQHLTLLQNRINEYNAQPEGDYDEYQMIQTLNAFHHVLLRHERDDTDFDLIFKTFGGECTLSECHAIHRHYTCTDESNPHRADTRALFDQIHCHFQHSYDIFRLRNDEKVDGFKALTAILNQKKNDFTQTVSTKRFTNPNNKFSANLGLVPLADTSTSTAYSYSFNFTYLTLQEQDAMVSNIPGFSPYYALHSDGLFGRQSCVFPPHAHASLKEEVLQNEIATISTRCWDNTVKDAHRHQQTAHCRESFIANTDNNNDYRRFYFHPSHFGYKDGDIITEKHIQCIIIYCSQDVFQSKYTATYRPWEKGETWKDIKHRHMNFYHFARGLREAVEVFGTLYREGNIESVYHGIEQEMIFNGMQANIYSPLSTTTSEAVAIAFANQYGLVLELKPNATLKYFECALFSKYSNEQEVLFIGGLDRLNFVNIRNSITCCDYREYINPLRMIDTMTYGVFFSEKITKWQNRSQLKIDEERIKRLKAVSKRLVEHQLSKSEESGRYSKWDDCPAYVDQLLHGMCSHKHKLWLDWETMNTDLLDEVEVLPDGNVGYLGYACFSPYFCHKGLEGMDLNLCLNLDGIMALFPSVQTITISRLLTIDAIFVTHIFMFLSLRKSLEQIKYINLRIDTSMGESNIDEYINKEKQHVFLKIGYEMTRSLDRNSKEHGLAFERLSGMLGGPSSMVIVLTP